MARILVAEDDPHILRVISLWLTRQGHDVVEARNGLAALELYEAQRPEILITDINMPGMDGTELLRRVLSQERLPRGIVVLTNRWDHREIGESLAESGVYTVPKPFSPVRLAELIQEIDGVSTTRRAP
jgi:two-component system OmpR family response regulator